MKPHILVIEVCEQAVQKNKLLAFSKKDKVVITNLKVVAVSDEFAAVGQAKVEVPVWKLKLSQPDHQKLRRQGWVDRDNS